MPQKSWLIQRLFALDVDNKQKFNDYKMIWHYMKLKIGAKTNWTPQIQVVS